MQMKLYRISGVEMLIACFFCYETCRRPTMKVQQEQELFQQLDNCLRSCRANCGWLGEQGWRKGVESDMETGATGQESHRCERGHISKLQGTLGFPYTTFLSHHNTILLVVENSSLYLGSSFRPPHGDRAACAQPPS